ncbi:MAG: rRNA pseudouridine synthase, partial [Firmicutes bacterium]|nr:rRNA pseudouridine synthase [Bacillota bacterium]
MERLQKYLARSGVASRRRAETLIKSGLVAVNGQVITELGVKVEPGRDRVTVAGQEVSPAAER